MGASTDGPGVKGHHADNLVRVDDEESAARQRHSKVCLPATGLNHAVPARKPVLIKAIGYFYFPSYSKSVVYE